MCTWLLVSVRAAAEQKRLVQAITSQGGEAIYAYKRDKGVPEPSPTLTSLFGVDFCADITEVIFPKGNATDAVMRTVSGLRELESLCVSDSPITDAGLEHVASLKKLVDVSLCGTDVSDAGMKSLSGLSRLHCLYLDRTKVTDAGLEALEGLVALHILSVRKTHVTEVGLARLQCLPKLGLLQVTVGRDGELDTSRLRRALPGCLVYGKDENGVDVP
jgi:hypothetical protein